MSELRQHLIASKFSAGENTRWDPLMVRVPMHRRARDAVHWHLWCRPSAEERGVRDPSHSALPGDCGSQVSLDAKCIAKLWIIQNAQQHYTTNGTQGAGVVWLKPATSGPFTSFFACLNWFARSSLMFYDSCVAQDSAIAGLLCHGSRWVVEFCYAASTFAFAWYWYSGCRYLNFSYRLPNADTYQYTGCYRGVFPGLCHQFSALPNFSDIKVHVFIYLSD